MAESKAIAARVHPDVHEWIKEQAEQEGTTLGSWVEELLRGAYLSHVEKQNLSEEKQKTKQVEEIPIESAEVEDGELVVEAESKEIADEVRGELSDHVLQSDDKRLKEVRLSPDAKREIAGL